MIVSFSIENWMSFRNRVTLSMVASRERQHGERVARLGKYQMRLLPAAVMYGGNASGKTNFFKALAFARTQVVRALPRTPGSRSARFYWRKGLRRSQPALSSNF